MAYDYLDTALPVGVSGSSLVCVYQFDGPTNGLKDRSGNNHDLSIVTRQHWSIDHYGQGMVAGAPDGWLQTDAKTGVFTEHGALTVEWVGQTTVYRDDQTSRFLWSIGPRGTGASYNISAALQILDSDAYPLGFRVLHEHGISVAEYDDFDWTEPFTCLHHGCLTKGTDGKTYRLYSDGVFLQEVVLPAVSDGGAGALRIYIHGSGNSSYDFADHHMSSWRYCKGVAFSDDQVAESFERIHVS